MKYKVQRRKQQDIIEYYGHQIRMEKYENDSDVSIWDERTQMPAYGRLDISVKQLKELAEVLPDFIKEIDLATKQEE
jgi:hypothetical protein